MTRGLLHSGGGCLASSLTQPSSGKRANTHIVPKDSAPGQCSTAQATLFLSFVHSHLQDDNQACIMLLLFNIKDQDSLLFLQSSPNQTPGITTFQLTCLQKPPSLTVFLVHFFQPVATEMEEDGHKLNFSHFSHPPCPTPAMAILPSVLEHSRMLMQLVTLSCYKSGSF